MRLAEPPNIEGPGIVLMVALDATTALKIGRFLAQTSNDVAPLDGIEEQLPRAPFGLIGSIASREPRVIFR